MQESCTCGAVFVTEKYKHLKKWRKNHTRNHTKEVSDKNGSEATTEVAERWQYGENYTWVAKKTIGFTMNEENKL